MRRSSQVVALAQKNDRENELRLKVEEGADNGLRVIDCGEKGRGIEAVEPFVKGSYRGELIPQRYTYITYILVTLNYE